MMGDYERERNGIRPSLPPNLLVGKLGVDAERARWLYGYARSIPFAAPRHVQRVLLGKGVGQCAASSSPSSCSPPCHWRLTLRTMCPTVTNPLPARLLHSSLQSRAMVRSSFMRAR